MKKLLLALAIITGFAACKNDPEPIEKTGAVQLLPSVAAYGQDQGKLTLHVRQFSLQVGELAQKRIDLRRRIPLHGRASAVVPAARARSPSLRLAHCPCAAARGSPRIRSTSSRSACQRCSSSVRRCSLAASCSSAAFRRSAESQHQSPLPAR